MLYMYQKKGSWMNEFQIIEKPLLSEKIVSLKEEENKIAFKVNRNTNKIEIKNTVGNLFGVKVKKVAVMNYIGKPKRQGKHEGKKSNWKKAIVTLEKGNTIEYFEGA